MSKQSKTWLVGVGLIGVMLIVIGIVAMSLEANSNDSLFMPLWDFCYDQLRGQVDSCAGWAEQFIEAYEDQPAECLELFDSDSALLYMCLANIERGAN